jgi:membrane protease YdiL (CAAX protease family)
MKTGLVHPPGFWRTVRLLLGATRKRSYGRRKRQQELLRSRTGKKGIDWGPLGFLIAAVMMLIINLGAAFAVRMAVTSGQRIEAERQGKIVVSDWFRKEATSAAEHPGQLWRTSTLNYSREARNIVREYGGSEKEIEQKLREAVLFRGASEFVTEDDAAPGLTALKGSSVFPAMLGSVMLLWWAVMLVFQGEGLEMDLQRRRHPMWEWLFTHPVPSGAIFFAEMLSPIAANPIYWSAPLFVGFLYGSVYGPETGIPAAFLIGIPVAIAAACLGKALEIGIILRFSPRTRGAMVGLMSWLGYASMMLLFFGLFAIPKVITAIWKLLVPLTLLPWPWLRLFVGGRADGSFSFVTGMLTCLCFSGVVIAGGIWFSVWGTKQGLSGNLGRADTGPSVSSRRRFGKDPLYRKEFLWFIRDRSAIVQTILIPLTVASFQLFNLRGLLRHAQGAWNYLCGSAILFGTYFLWILGPKSLAPEGSALWIALTWPRGLESLLKAKAWLWSMISSGIVALVLCYAAYLFPGNIWQVVLVGIGWFFFGRSMAEKTVTLVTVTSSSGQPEKIPWGRRWAAQLGMLTFAIGVLTQQWPVAVRGIVYSYITAAAMWENFRARLPYLYDPWSERVPPPPTLMHAMISISILVEAGAVIFSAMVGIGGSESIALAQAMAYGICAVVVSVGVASFLSGRGVANRDVWRWPPAGAPDPEADSWWRRGMSAHGKTLLLLLVGAAGGLVLGLFAHGYVAILQHIPAAAELIRRSQEQLAKVSGMKISIAVMSVGFAPFAEEYLFRGLLYRALDREWGGWRAVIGGAAFFAIYHPPLSWLPVALLGMSNAILFKKTGWLAPAVVLHLVYNAVVLL